jgi:hypothetical protein
VSEIRKAISVQAPWWWYILHGYKDIENRDWYTSQRGAVWLHVGKWWKPSEIAEDIADIHEAVMEPGIIVPPRLSDLQPFCGHIVGSVEIVDCVRQHNSRWFNGRFGFVLRNPVPLDTPIPFRGQLGFFNVPEELIGDAA